MTAEIGAQFLAKNGYRYVKTEDGWRLNHHLIAEEMLGRRLAPTERVSFINGNKADLTPSNLKVAKSTKSKANRIDYLQNKIKVLQEELAELLAKS